ncbi:Receptor-type guanylate cyclase gcy [Seminavis robusta]|uniref:Receptor-type guanylate cyclase gcy n=1 Tax=Seminavis robusta TaxID=568900 RepID=A0A9N8H4L8_9STRA|nr:Receptor-type guanylate cyclase gcy [Seminavis robusta]|eukprot:Sro66_g037240.1 Receptor-type guanylate cyclase gcy (801) ;mRNA; f:87923-90910
MVTTDDDQSNASCFHDEEADLVATPKDQSAIKREKIAETEDRALFCLRLLVIFFLVAAAVGISTLVYMYLSGEEQRAFESRFNSDVRKILDSIGSTLDRTLGPADALIVNTLAYAKTANLSFPFVTLPLYGLQATKLLRISKGFQIHMSFEVREDQKEEWEQYAESHLKAIDEALDIEEGDPDWYGPVYRDYGRCEIYSWGGVPKEAPNNITNTYIPNWHEFPVSSGSSNISGGCPYNFDQYNLPDVLQAILYMKKTQKAVIGNFPNVNFDVSDPAQAQIKAIMDAGIQQLLPPGTDAREPFTQVAIPIFDSVDSVYVDTSEPQRFLGFMALSIMFRDLIEGLLPPDSNGIYLVLEQSCGVPFTYKLDGHKATYIGVGHQHEEEYSHMMQEHDLAGLIVATHSETRDSTYTGIPLSTEFCPNTIKIYPSAQMEANFTSSSPIIMGSITAAIFLLTSLTFATYDCLVSRRQRLVKEKAMESGAIVESLFPEDVRNRLYQENRQRQTMEQQISRFEATTPSGHFQRNTNQIAQVYHNTTIFFGDLAGFTAWSGSRQPNEVFELLETLYGAFDAIANKLHVYKVETIGDCYVAITGCPNEQEDHCVRMVRFAKECMARTTSVTQRLSDVLGADTMDLCFRVGLHSGHVTAGVLRGERGRFQLFGDTVNVASRMESNGVKGRIHCSEETARILRVAGKGSWLVPREDKIVAKGKGELQTYFIETTGIAKSTVSSVSTHTTNASHVDSTQTTSTSRLDSLEPSTTTKNQTRSILSNTMAHVSRSMKDEITATWPLSEHVETLVEC